MLCLSDITADKNNINNIFISGTILSIHYDHRVKITQ